MQTSKSSLVYRLATFAMPCVLLASACFLKQELDEGAARGSARVNQVATGNDVGSSAGGTSIDPSTTGAGMLGSGGGPGTGGSAGGGFDASPDACEMTRSAARDVLQNDCAGCHESPNKEGNFDFILELDKLRTMVASTNVPFVTPGDTANSRIYQRISAGEMPPAGKMPRPSPADVMVIGQWITSCFDGTSGWDRPDAGAPDAMMEAGPPPGCGDPGQPCCVANDCHNNGCCVFGQCRGAGQSCEGVGGGLGLAGMCTNGSCQNTAGMTCGNVNQPCCDASSCTASRVSCLAGMTTCSACGGANQPCCKQGSGQECIDGQACVGAGVNRTGNCHACGAMGGPCCGTGVAAQKKCDP